MNQTRRPNIQMHRARPASAEAKRERTGEIMADNQEDMLYKMAYIEFLNKLMVRMKVDSLKKMLDLAMEQID